ncbi:hypothetical protein [Crenobacter cavernae]|uniref:hypothetical protein n=1 Tax=Crenobacter cavernae TaxID=2290923 RepID=UPI00100FF054|nr:hypothetical protein [Crenobacter cavernae]
MKITVYRQACCSQDDQLGPLEAEYNIGADTTFSSLIQDVVKSNFLQFSSSHNRITGEIDGKEMVVVFCQHITNNRQPEFKISPSTSAIDLLNDKKLSFYFRHV